MFNNEFNKDRTLTPYNALNEPMHPMVDEEDEELVTQYKWFIIDKSGSIKPYESLVYDRIIKTLSSYAEVNDSSIDGRILVKMALFDDEVTEFNSVHLEPQKLINIFTRDKYKCGGCTNEGNMKNYIGSELSRSAPNSVVKTLRKNTPGFDFIIFTDGKSNDPIALREEARRMLASNHFYREYARIIVCYIGDDEAHKDTAIALANGHAENVIALDSDKLEYLDSFILKSTVIFPDGTHINDSEGTQMLNSVAEEVMEREKQGEHSVDLLSDADVAAELRRLMGEV